MRPNPSLTTQTGRREPESIQPRRPGDRRWTIVELLIGRTRPLVHDDKGKECQRRTLLEDNPTSG